LISSRSLFSLLMQSYERLNVYVAGLEI